jgi:hypothetical protein
MLAQRARGEEIAEARAAVESVADVEAGHGRRAELRR